MIDPNTVLAELKSALDAVAAETVSVWTPPVKRFDAVVRGVGLRVPSVDRLAMIWFDGEDAEEETLGNVMTDYRFGVALCWLANASASDTPRLEAEMMESLRRVKAVLRSRSTLNGAVTDLKLGPASRFVGPLADMVVQAQQAPVYHQLRFDVIVRDLEGEVISG